MEERHNCFQAVFLCLNFLITSVIWCCIQEGLFEVCATTQTSQSRPVTLLGKLFCYNQPCHLQLLTRSSHRGVTEASLSSRMLGFKDVNSRSGIWYLGCALPFSYSHYQHVGNSPCQHRVTCSQGPKRFWLHY